MINNYMVSSSLIIVRSITRHVERWFSEKHTSAAMQLTRAQNRFIRKSSAWSSCATTCCFLRQSCWCWLSCSKLDCAECSERASSASARRHSASGPPRAPYSRAPSLRTSSTNSSIYEYVNKLLPSDAFQYRLWDRNGQREEMVGRTTPTQ